MTVLVLVHLAATVAMVGIIWSVQCVQYPLFAQVPHSKFAQYHDAHVRRIGFVVAPLMLIEVASGAALLWYVSPTPGLIAAFVLLGVVWASTFFIQVPVHRKLSSSWSPQHVLRLVRGNWIRTVAWTARAVVLLGAVPQLLSR